MAGPQAPDPTYPDEDEWSPSGMSPLRKVALTALMVVLGVVPGLMLLASDPLPDSTGETAGNEAGVPSAPVEGSRDAPDVAASPDEAPGSPPAPEGVPVPEPVQPDPPVYVPPSEEPPYVPSSPFSPVPDAGDGSVEEGEPGFPAEGAGAGDDEADADDDAESDEDDGEGTSGVEEEPKPKRRLISIRLAE